MGYVITALVSIGLTLLLVSWGEISRGLRDRKNKKQRNRLANGVPSHVVTLYEFEDIYKYRNNPIYINGKSYLLDKWGRFNDDYDEVYLYDAFEKLAGTLERVLGHSVKIEGRWLHSYEIRFNPNNGPSLDILPMIVKAVY